MQAALERRAFIILLLLVTGLFLYLMKPFFGAVLWACIIGVLFHPVQMRLESHWGRRPNLTALTTLTLCVIMVIIPVLFVLGSFLREGASLYQALETGKIDPGAYVDRIREAFPVIQNLLDRLQVDVASLKERLADTALTTSGLIAQNTLQVGRNTLQFFVSLGLMLYLTFFLLRDGEKLLRLIERALPIGDERERLLFARFSEVARATVKGNLVVATIQGTLGGLIFWILGIPGALLWGVVMILLSLIPVVGAGLIWAPVAIYLFAVGDWVQGLILTIFGAGVIGLVDNILRPILVGRDTKLPDYVVLLSTLGGIVTFGLNGFVIGPLIAVLFTAFWGIFMRDFHRGPEEQSASAAEEDDGEGQGGGTT
ncbi:MULTISPECIES: AI-2E family transporter [unclassified Ectothiorhodospira]|uniref:AI-2E family transporter n=1 Tax=unclassified Ectothiorhodospira TaxID=2684909 RepID=UPI001EE793FC|nr:MULTISPECIES: AI-2E family transporter [unclassified Ectothiorhodospira]MCG5516092.1 AI-2E family transporter [Ectothiorhodospira sp. 9100]MCG5519098.1 AI-2E family transporter [Ectothiorhodospira sp. 9905]